MSGFKERMTWTAKDVVRLSSQAEARAAAATAAVSDGHSTSIMVALLPDGDTSWCLQTLPHVTLVYAGQVDDAAPGTRERLERACAELSLAHAPLIVPVTGVETFGREERVDVLTLEPGQLEPLHDVVEWANASEFTEYRPHATIGPEGSAASIDAPPVLRLSRLLFSWGHDSVTWFLVGQERRTRLNPFAPMAPELRARIFREYRVAGKGGQFAKGGGRVPGADVRGTAELEAAGCRLLEVPQEHVDAFNDAALASLERFEESQSFDRKRVALRESGVEDEKAYELLAEAYRRLEAARERESATSERVREIAKEHANAAIETYDYAKVHGTRGEALLAEYDGYRAALAARAGAQARTDYLYAEHGAGRTREQFNREAERHFQEFADRGEVTVRLGPAALQRVIDDGRFQTKWETGRGKTKDMDKRDRVESQEFGGSRPVYGALEVTRRAAGASGDFFDGNDILTQYGKVQVVLRPEVKARSTITLGDSLDNPAIVPVPMTRVRLEGMGVYPGYDTRANTRATGGYTAADRGVSGGIIGGIGARSDPSSWAPNPTWQRASYFEVQVHGGVSVSDIAHVILPSKPSAALQAQLEGAGVEWSTMKPQKVEPT